MSEYQYYEFKKVTGKLTSYEQNALRSISSRAQITATSFINFYHYSDLNASPKELLKRYFDLYLYTANWGSAMFAIKVPKQALDKELINIFAAGDIFEIDETDKYWTLRWSTGDIDDYGNIDYSDLESDSELMQELEDIRDEILSGDLRSLYLGWLAGVHYGEVSDDAKEPMLVSGLGQLTQAQQNLCELLQISPDLVSAAALGSPVLSTKDNAHIDDYVEHLPESQLRKMAKALLEGKGVEAQQQLKIDYATWSRCNADSVIPSSRSLSEIRMHIDSMRNERLAKETLIMQQQAEQARIKQEARIKRMYKDSDKHWHKIRSEIETGSGRSYDAATDLLGELYQSYCLYSEGELFKQKLNKLMESQKRRPALITRLQRKGLIS